MDTLKERTGTRDRRKNMPPIPENFRQVLKPAQKITLNHLEKFGWKLAFIRRPLFVPPTTFIHNAEKSIYAVVEETGKVKFRHGYQIRAA